MKAKYVWSAREGSYQLSNILSWAASDCGLSLGDVDVRPPHTVQFRLRLAKGDGIKRYQRTSYNPFNIGRKVNAVCWHGFRDFFRACYRYNDNIEFITHLGIYGLSVDMKRVTYYSLQQFNAVYPETDVEVGGDLYRALISQCCTCKEAGD